MNADQILVLDQGEIVQQGTHNELMTQSGIYNQMVRLQVENPIVQETVHD
jgi:ABC-type multidrug transport system fused ATPase/permease subunit